MVPRKFWMGRIERAWIRRSIIWLAGVRRIGKTFLCRSLENILYLDCELPRVRHQLEDPERFLESHAEKRMVLDEIHRLDNPAELLKIAADHFPNIRIIATGSSTLGASKKFKDTLTGRKTRIHLTPMLAHETAEFDCRDLYHRLLNGGLPPFFLEEFPKEADYQEWLSSYWAKDVRELYQVEKQHSFIKFIELVLAHSGSLFEATRFAAPCEVSRTTVGNYLAVLAATFVAYIVRPYSTSPRAEIVSTPKVYGFDTGFVCHARGWTKLRPGDFDGLWEHLVLGELNGHLQEKPIQYWRDKRGHKVDFVLANRGGHKPTTIECKWSAAKFDPTNLHAFRRRYPDGTNFVVASDVGAPYQKKYGGLPVTFMPLEEIGSIINP